MADESTPLIQRVDVRPHRDRYPHHRLRFVCTTLLSATIIAGGLAAVFLFAFAPPTQDEVAPASRFSASSLSTSQIPDGWARKTTLDFEGLKAALLETPSAEKAEEWSRYYTSGPHLAGKNLSQALWTRERWQEWGVESTIVDYDVYINYPKGHRLALMEKIGDKEDAADSTTKQEWKVKYEARLEEDVLDEDKSSQLADRVPTFHGYSASGNVTAPYVFVNYGTYRDFEELQAANVSLEGKIALAKYGGVFRGLKVKRAQELGMVGVAMYTDPGDDGEVTEKNGVATYPDGPAREPSSVQRGSVQFLSKLLPIILSCHANNLQASRQVTLPLQAIPRNLAALASPSTTRCHTSHLFPSPTSTRFPFSKPSMATVRKPHPSTSTGTAAVWTTRAWNITLGPRQTTSCSTWLTSRSMLRRPCGTSLESSTAPFPMKSLFSATTVMLGLLEAQGTQTAAAQRSTRSSEALELPWRLAGSQ